ncbi:hypothetical protein [Basilea psittacipulmonis]|uniref:Uncharacterized protein n=1 Tax=Basilea psittacipulmonis DSM 24701 TaxID=1072685 RepID=A0A077DG20_9BURK|nr:hypothetical protein [Basilea psittacipulmonis]AIL33116.1 hypothetical protein IX83_07210 [Basilea psittacipulmonis DSM 24701]
MAIKVISEFNADINGVHFGWREFLHFRTASSILSNVYSEFNIKIESHVFAKRLRDVLKFTDDFSKLSRFEDRIEAMMCLIKSPHELDFTHTMIIDAVDYDICAIEDLKLLQASWKKVLKEHEELANEPS